MNRIATTVVALTTCGIVTTIIVIAITNSNIIIFRELVKRKTEIVMSLSVIDPRTQPQHHHSNEGIDRWDYFHHLTLSKKTFIPFLDFCYLFKFVLLFLFCSVFLLCIIAATTMTMRKLSTVLVQMMTTHQREWITAGDWLINLHW